MKTETNMKPFGRVATLVSAGLAIACGISSVDAAVRTWTGGGSPDFNWSNAANWGGATPAASDDLVFPGSIGLQNTNDLTVFTTFRSITFPSGAGAFVLEGNGVMLSSGFTNLSSSVQTMHLHVQNNTQVSYNTAGNSVIFNVGPWNNRFSKTGPFDLICYQMTNQLNGQITSLNAGRLIMAGLSNGIAGLGLQIDAGGTAVSCGPANQIGDADTRADVTMSGGLLQLQNTNAAGVPTFELIPMLRGATNTAVVENGSALGPVQLRVGGGTGARVGAFDGTLRDGSGGGALSVMLTNGNGAVYWRLGGTNSYTGDTVVTNGFASGYTRLIVNGLNSGGGNYTIQGSSAGGLAVLAGAGTIVANTVNVNSNGIIAPGGVLNGTTLYARQGGGASGSAGINTGTFAESTAALTITNNVNLNTSNSTLDIHLGSTNVGGYDQLVIGGAGVFSNNNANLQLTVDIGFIPNAGDQFTIVKAAGTSSANNIGVFASLNGVPTDLSQGAIISLNGSQFKISYRAEGSTFDAGVNGNDIMLQALTDTSAKLTWRGDINGDWDIRTTANWRLTNNTSATFTNLDKVTFDDSSVTANVNLTTDLNPSTLLVNATKDYSFTGSGKLTGAIVLTKTNTGTLSVATANDFVGAAVIDKGTLKINDGGAISSGITVNSNGIFAFSHSDGQTFSPATLSGTGKFVHDGSGSLTIPNDYSSFTGITTNSGGTLTIGTDVASGNGARLGGMIYVAASSALEYKFTASQTIASSLSGAGTVTYGGSTASGTISFGSTTTNSGFTGTSIMTTMRVQAGTAAASPGGPILVQTDGQGRFGTYYSSFANFTNQNSISIVGRGASGVDSPRPKGALRLANAWAGPITMTGDATIGASSGTGTVLGNISDGGNNYTLEYFGGTILVGPTTGANSYGATTIAEDLNGNVNAPILTTVRALNNNPFGSGIIQMVGLSRLEVNGNNVSIANLVDLPGSAGSNFPPIVVNGSSTTQGTLLVGTDNQDQTFAGLFGNGGSQAFNLNKVGTGKFTVSGDSTNTGTVTVSAGTLALADAQGTYQNGQSIIGSGSFSNAAAFAVATGATLDVSGRTSSGGALTLNANQTLKHVGPGTGAITVIGNVNIGAGRLLLAVNHSGLASDSISVSGTFTPGGTLAVTNIGGALQAGDSFSLFQNGTPGFAAFNLPTNDVVNNVKYTWNNTVGTDGKISVASVGPLVNQTPTNIVSSVSNGQLTLSWPTDHIGWTLQVQTNTLSVGLATNWVAVPNSASTNQITIPISTANGAVFYRLVYP